MTFNIDGFKTIESGGAIGSGEGSVKRIHHYATNDLLSEVDNSGYFNSATSYLNKGDLIFVSGDVDGTPATNCFMVTSATGAATVTTVGFDTVTQTYVNQYVIEGKHALTDGTYYVAVAPKAGTISKIYTVIDGTVATNDGICTYKINTTSITDGAVTIATSGSAAGVVDSATPSAANTLAAGDYISVVVSGTPGSSRNVVVGFLIDAA